MAGPVQVRVKKREEMGSEVPSIVHWISTAGTAGPVQVRVKMKADIGREGTSIVQKAGLSR
jgi:hypothetical protein